MTRIMYAGTAISILQAFQKLGGIKLPIKEAYAVAKITATLRNHPEVAAVDAVRVALIEKYSDEGGVVRPSSIPKFLLEYSPEAARSFEVDLPDLPMSILDSISSQESNKPRFCSEDLDALMSILV